MFFQPIIPLLFIIVLFVVGTLLFVIAVKTSKRGIKLRWVLRFGCFVLLTLMLLRPGLSYVKEVETYVPNTEIFFVVDTTSSMSAVDSREGQEDSTRLDAVKEDISVLVDQYPNSRISLVTFDSVTRTVVPLTRSVSTFMVSLNSLTTEVNKHSAGSEIRIVGTDLEVALTSAKELNPDSVQVVYFFSDGEETVDVPVAESFDSLSSLIGSGQVYGYGSVEGAKMLTYTGYYVSNTPKYVQDPTTGTDAVSVPDENNLIALADELQVEYQNRYQNSDITFPDFKEDLKTENLTTDTVEDYTWVLGMLFLILVSVEVGTIFYVLTKQRKMSESREGNE